MSTRILDSMHDPGDLRGLSDEEKARLATEIRHTIIDTVADNGGHLAPNLGVVELTIALLSTFDPPDDTIVFDVGHQCYAWKLLTGRADRFSTLRLKGGISGFPKTEESPYDAFNTGHSSTSISAALGIARAKRLRGDSTKTVAIIGDGALGGGMAYEALSDAGQSGDNMLVILNDNQMCIDHAVGGIARHLEHLRTSTRYIRLKTVWEERLNRIPVVGEPIIRMLARIKKHMRTKDREFGSIFEALGFRYYGPIDGHQLPELERHLRAVKLIRGPVLLHVITEKGKGYTPAEEAPEYYHGVGTFDQSIGIVARDDDRPPTFSHVMGATAVELAHRDPRVVAITAAMAQGTGLIPFSEAFPSRFWDVGIAEQHAVTLAAGMAKEGLRPIVALYSTFLQRAIDQVLHDVCLQRLPVTFVIDRAGLVSRDGETHQGIYDLALTLSLPNLTVTAPATANDLAALLNASLKHDGPMMIRYPNDIACEDDLGLPNIPPDAMTLEDLVPLRRLRQGRDLTVVVLGALAPAACRAVDQVLRARPNKSIDLYACIVAFPFDYTNMLISIHTTHALLVIEEATEVGGFGSLIASETIRRAPGTHIETLGVTHPLAGQASRAELAASESLDVDGMAARMMALLDWRDDRPIDNAHR
ncbi:MAG: 1-deoxy-D-xylulose-5-phosphate synthase [Saccharofermentanales bacterium]